MSALPPTTSQSNVDHFAQNIMFTEKALVVPLQDFLHPLSDDERFMAEIAAVLRLRLGHVSSFPFDPIADLRKLTMSHFENIKKLRDVILDLNKLIFKDKESLVQQHSRALKNLKHDRSDAVDLKDLGKRFAQVSRHLTIIEPFLEYVVEANFHSLPQLHDALTEPERRLIRHKRQETLIPLYMLWALRGIYNQSSDIAKQKVRPGATRLLEAVSVVTSHLEPLVLKGKMQRFKIFIDPHFSSKPLILHLNFWDSNSLLSNLIANAASHGKMSSGQVAIYVRLRKEGAKYILEVENLFDPVKKQPDREGHFGLGMREIDVLCRLYSFEKRVDTHNHRYRVRIIMPAQPPIPEAEWQRQLLQSQKTFLAVSAGQRFQPVDSTPSEAQAPQALLRLGRNVKRILPSVGTQAEKINFVLARTFESLEELLQLNLSAAPESRLELHEALLDVARMALEDVQAIGVPAMTETTRRILAEGMASVTMHLTEAYADRLEYPLLLADSEVTGYVLHQAIKPAARWDPVVPSDSLGQVFSAVRQEIRTRLKRIDYTSKTIRLAELKASYKGLPKRLGAKHELTATMLRATVLLEQTRVFERLEKAEYLLDNYPGLSEKVEIDLDRYRAPNTSAAPRVRAFLDFATRALWSGDLAAMRSIDEMLSNYLTLLANVSIRDVHMIAEEFRPCPMAPDLVKHRELWLDKRVGLFAYELTALGGSPIDFVGKTRIIRAQLLILERLNKVDQWLSDPDISLDNRDSNEYRAFQQRRARFFTDNKALEDASKFLYDDVRKSRSLPKDERTNLDPADVTAASIAKLEELLVPIYALVRQVPVPFPGVPGADVWKPHMEIIVTMLQNALQSVSESADWAARNHEGFAKKLTEHITYANVLLKKSWDEYLYDNPLFPFLNPQRTMAYLSTNINAYLPTRQRESA